MFTGVSRFECANIRTVSQNKVLTVKMDAIKSQMSSLNSDQAKKISKIILMKGQLKHDMTEIRMNMQFLSESVTAMISSLVDEILRRFNVRKGCPVNEYEDTEAAIVGCEESHAVEGFEKIDEGSPTREPASELPVKRASRPARILRSPFVAGKERCAISHQFDAAKCRPDIASLLYKHREPYVKKAR
ncbi:Hypothetical predicted protein [Olea europaea subsp. europaea]|uniref:Uncharacterized protein n=1 Tax=Olea europaea subsp. europaea TaxID=158383 RepID=A0A8S0VP48_OLEEU|nr:Hypothetical predicted protein [Olea europaea subsp. europaea]